MLALGEREKGAVLTHARLFLLTYVFLLRLPSEALPVVAGLKGRVPDTNAALFRDGSSLVLVLKRRKNKQHGSILTRSCTCRSARAICVVHVLGPVLEKCRVGQPVFGGCTAASAMEYLRMMLLAVNVDRATEYRTHDLRRGHAEDLAEAGRPLHEILTAGEWSSPAFLKYLDLHKLESQMVVQSHCDESDEED